MDEKLQNVKYKIKRWESDFTKKNSRKPSKDDIKGSEIEAAYTEYWQAKNKLNSEIWSDQFNKSADVKQKVSRSVSKVKPACSFTDKLWKSSLKDRKVDPIDAPNKVIKVPVYCYPDKKGSPLQNNETPETGTCASEEQKEWTFSLTNTKFSVKSHNHVTARKQSFALPTTKLKSAEVSEDWLNKCISASETEKKDGEDADNCFSDSSPFIGLKRYSTSNDLSTLNVLSANDTNPLLSLQSKIARPKAEILERNILQDSCDTSIVENESSRISPSRMSPQNATPPFNTNVQANLDESAKENAPRLQKTNCESSLCSSPSQQNNYSVPSRSPRVPKDVFPVPSLLQTKASNTASDSSVAVSELDMQEDLVMSKKAKCIPKKRKLQDEQGDEAVLEGPKSKRSRSDKGSGVVSENFVKINIQRKKFTRGPNKMKARQWKRIAWKKKKMAASNGKCFSCGQPGHWSNNCPKKAEILLNEEALNEAKQGDTSNVITATAETNLSHSEQPVPREPIASFDDEEYVTDRMNHFLKKFKHKEFRPFQENAIRHILSGQSTLLVLPTGSGKSLCYQIPAIIYAEKSRCITLVISPLVSLMEDQVKNLPSFLSSVCVHSGQTPAERQKSLESAKSGSAHILLIAPESLLLMHAYFRTALPPIAFACIDEAHCLSEWSYNFRPAYLQVLKVLKQSLNVNCVLGLSATVTKGTVNRISCLLDINSEEAVFGGTSVPNNLLLSISQEDDKEKALNVLLESDGFKSLRSIIIYCSRRETTEQVATRIRIHMQNSQHSKASRTENNKKDVEERSVAHYHAGLTAAQRRSIQKKFMTGKLHVIVATVAFGMGLNKADVRAVVHFDMPKSFESYVQEIGRAGRDGKPAFCHLFLHPQGDDLCQLKRHIYANGVERHSIRKLLSRIFLPHSIIKEDVNPQADSQTEIAISIDEVVRALDVKKEIIETLLCYLELHPQKWFKVLPTINDTCTIQCYGGPEQLERIILQCKPLSVATSLHSTEKTSSKLTFSLVQICSQMGWDSELVRKDLRNLQFVSKNGSWHRTGTMVEFGNPSFHLVIYKTLSSEQKDQLLNFVHDISVQLEKKELRKLNSLFQAFKRFSKPSCIVNTDYQDTEASNNLKQIISDYFRDSHVNTQETTPKQALEEDAVRREIRSFLDIYHEETFNARQLAQIFYGIGSPQFPMEVWGKVRRFWRSHLHVDFPDLIAIAKQEMLRLKF